MSNYKLDYSKLEVPPDYRCGSCGTDGVKLWRYGSTFKVELRCAACAVKEVAAEGDMKPDAVVGCDGKIVWEYGLSDQIGSFVPAVPSESNDGYYWYTSVPPGGVAWWKRLPLRVLEELPLSWSWFKIDTGWSLHVNAKPVCSITPVEDGVWGLACRNGDIDRFSGMVRAMRAAERRFLSGRLLEP